MMALTRRNERDVTRNATDSGVLTDATWTDDVFAGGKPTGLSVTTCLVNTGKTKRTKATRTRAAMTVPVFCMTWYVRSAEGVLLHREFERDADSSNPTKTQNAWIRRAFSIG